MKVIVFGSTGGTGRKIIDVALAQEYTVTAFARDPAKLGIEHARLRTVRGDVMDAASVERAVRGHDAVLCALGTPAWTRTTVRSDGTRNIIRAMQNVGVRRIVSVSSIGIGDSKPMLPFVYAYILVPLLLRQGFAEHELQEACMRQSEMDWTIVRPGALTNGERTSAYRHGITTNGRAIRARVSRADVADFVLKQLSDDTYVRRAPWVSY